MALASCARCRRLYQKIRSPICPSCEKDEDVDYEKVREFLGDNPGSNVDQVAEATGVTKECVRRLLSQGRIGTTAEDAQAKCGMCGAPAISASKKLCESCLQKLNEKIAKEQSKSRLPEKKEVKLRTSIFDGDDESGVGGTKYKR